MPLPAPGQAPQYAGTYDCARKTVQREGFRGLYKGSFDQNSIISHYNTFIGRSMTDYDFV